MAAIVGESYGGIGYGEEVFIDEERRGRPTRMMIGSIARKRWAIERSHEFTKACV